MTAHRAPVAERVASLLRRAGLGQGRVLALVSGGADSTLLVAVLAELGFDVRGLHVAHGLRGAESDADAAFVAALCKRLGVSLHLARWDTRARMRRRKLAGENGLRTLRREFFDAAAKRVGAGVIATAHTADDQLETVLLRLMRGTGLRGLGGMRPRAGRWIKPLLEATRADLEADLRAARQPWREDASNSDASFTRNRVRHGVVPALIAALPGAGGDGGRNGERDAGRRGGRSGLALRVAALAAELREVESALRRWTRPLARAATANSVHARIPLERLRRFPAAARRELIRAVWRQVAPPNVGLTAPHLVQIDRLEAGAVGPVGLPAGFAAWREGDTLLIGVKRIQEKVLPGAGPTGNPARPARGGRSGRKGTARSGGPGTGLRCRVGRDFRKRGI